MYTGWYVKNTIMLVAVFILTSFLLGTEAYLFNYGHHYRYEWNSWGSWSTCHVDCNQVTTHTYHQSRTRTCHDNMHHTTTTYYQHCHHDHTGHEETRTCQHNCPSNYSWSTWGRWSTCHVNCGLLATHVYNQTRARVCHDNTRHHTTSVNYCGGSSGHQETRTCSNNCATWATWSSWSDCSATCGGVTIRVRHCQPDDRSCAGEPVETKPCGSVTCSQDTVAINDTWGTWHGWSACSHSCGYGVRVRGRSCDNPTPTNGGNTCVGLSLLTEPCILSTCPIDGGWGDWANWSSCSVTCGSGHETRARFCNSPPPEYGGSFCDGPSAIVRTCSLSQCQHTVDGGWGDWTSWTDCSATCGGGQAYRARLCNNPLPQNGGKNCSHEAVAMRTCGDDTCAGPVDGGWSAFTAQPCSVTCGKGVLVIHRTCSNPSPSRGGKECEGSATEFAVCSESDCPVDGTWSTWSTWSTCNVVCGYGHTWRFRSCSSPSPEHGGANCTGAAHERQLCHNASCPDDVKTCYDSQILDLIYTSPYVIDSAPSPPMTCDSPISQQEQLLSNICHVNSSALGWKLGTQLSSNCDKTPLFSPVAVISTQNNDRKYGILLDCYHDVIQIADLACGLKATVYQANNPENDYRIILM